MLITPNGEPSTPNGGAEGVRADEGRMKRSRCVEADVVGGLARGDVGAEEAAPCGSNESMKSLASFPRPSCAMSPASTCRHESAAAGSTWGRGKGEGGKCVIHRKDV